LIYDLFKKSAHRSPGVCKLRPEKNQCDQHNFFKSSIRRNHYIQNKYLKKLDVSLNFLGHFMRNSNLKTKKAEKTVQKSSFKLVVSGSINFRHKKLGFKFKISIQFFRKWNVTFFVVFFFGGPLS